MEYHLPVTSIKRSRLTILIQLLSFLLINISVIYPQSKEELHESNFFSSFINDFSSIYEDGYGYYNTMAKNIGENWQGYSAGIVGFAVLTFSDEEIYNSITTTESSKFWNTVNDFGNLKYLMISGGAIYLTGRIAKDNDAKALGLSLVKGLIYSGIAVYTLKALTGRARPYLKAGSQEYKPFSFYNDYNALPSGNAAVVFTAATVLSNYFNNNFMSACLYSTAIVSSFARLKKNQHWFSDVLLGSLIGISSGSYVSKNFTQQAVVLPLKNFRLIATHNSLNIIYYLN